MSERSFLLRAGELSLLQRSLFLPTVDEMLELPEEPLMKTAARDCCSWILPACSTLSFVSETCSFTVTRQSDKEFPTQQLTPGPPVYWLNRNENERTASVLVFT